ncbi:NAD(P)-binding domain-containing protein, partial [Patescibacteria group bacterium]
MLKTGKNQIAILGLGIEGQSLVKHFLSKGKKICVFDRKKETDLGPLVTEFKKRGVRFYLGKDYLK